MAKEVTPEQIAQIDEMVARAHTALISLQRTINSVLTVSARLLQLLSAI